MKKNRPLPDWLLSHDDKTIFTFAYIGLSIFLSIFFGIFWLFLIVMVHLAMDIIVNISKNITIKRSFILGFWELKLDFSLILFSLTLAVYIDVVLGVLGIGHAARGIAQIGSRTHRAGAKAVQVASRTVKTGSKFASWQNILESFFLSVDDFFKVVKAFFNKKKLNKPVKIEESTKESPEIEMTFVSFLPILFGLILLLLLLFSPIIMNKSFSEIISVIFEELKPF